MFNSDQIQRGRPRASAALSHGMAAAIGAATSAILVLTIAWGVGGSDRATVQPAAEAVGDAVSSSAEPAVGQPRSVRAPVTLSLVTQRDWLTAQSFARPIRFGPTSEDTPSATAQREERLFAEALALEGTAAAQPVAPWFVLTARSRARPVRFGDGVAPNSDERAVMTLEDQSAIDFTTPPFR